LSFDDKSDILLEKRLSGVAGQGHTIVYGESQVDDILGEHVVRTGRLWLFSAVAVVSILGLNVYAGNAGLAGVLYESSDFGDARQTFILNSLDNSWGEDDQLGKGCVIDQHKKWLPTDEK
jgi:hypothetical protein